MNRGAEKDEQIRMPEWRELSDVVEEGRSEELALFIRETPREELAAGRSTYMGKALLTAVLSSRDDMARMLLAAGADPDGEADPVSLSAKRKISPLSAAVSMGNRVLLEMLIGAGANPDGREGSASPILAAAREWRADALRLLIDAGANPKVKDAHGRTALHLALSSTAALNSAVKGDGAMTALILAEFVSAEEKDDSGSTARDEMEEALKMGAGFDRAASAYKGWLTAEEERRALGDVSSEGRRKASRTKI